ncbi:hypothetical protein V6Z11_D12G219000 [Gossypium hirsutum]
MPAISSSSLPSFVSFAPCPTFYTFFLRCTMFYRKLALLDKELGWKRGRQKDASDIVKLIKMIFI